MRNLDGFHTRDDDVIRRVLVEALLTGIAARGEPDQAERQQYQPGSHHPARLRLLKKSSGLASNLLFLSLVEHMFESMDLDLLSQDQKERILVDAEVAIAKWRALQVDVLEDLDRCQVAMADGCRSLSEWTTARLDLHPDTATSLVRTMRRTAERPDLRGALATGEISFDRMEALSRITEEMGLLEHLDVAGVRREAAKRVRITAEDEYRTASDQFLVMQPFPGRIMVERLVRNGRSHRSSRKQDSLGESR